MFRRLLLIGVMTCYTLLQPSFAAGPPIESLTYDHTIQAHSTAGTAPSQRLDIWGACSARQPTEAGQSLCMDESRSKFSTYDRFYRLLDDRAVDTATLCTIDLSIVVTFRQCIRPEIGDRYDHETEWLMAYLMPRLAEKWRLQGSPERADQLYQQSYDSLVRIGGHALERFVVLHAWIPLKVVLGEAVRANELLDLFVAMAREIDRCERGRKSTVELALLFQADTLARLGDARGAEAARTQARSLAALPYAVDRQCKEGMHERYPEQ
jgi:hypothetical protein